MTLPRTDFALVPDRCAARKVRRLIAEAGGQANLFVGTWPELMELARQAYLLPPVGADPWPAAVAEVMSNLPDTFWAESFRGAPEDTAAVVRGALERLLDATPEGRDWKRADGLSERAEKHLGDLGQLRDALGTLLPAGQEMARAILQTPGADTIRTIAVHTVDRLPRLSPVQRLLVDKLNRDAGSINPDLIDALRTYLEPEVPASAPEDLRHLQEHLFATVPVSSPSAAGLQWVTVRDPLEEVEVVAGMIQTRLAANSAITFADFGMLLPDDPSYADAVRSVFAEAGIPHSGLPVGRLARDLGAEAVRHFVMIGRGPAPVMAIASLVASPLMPWSKATGSALANALMNGDFRLKPQDGMDERAQQLLGVLRRSRSSRGNLATDLPAFVSLIGDEGDLSIHAARARSLAAALLEQVGTGGNENSIDAFLRPAPIVLTAEETVTREGVSIFVENQEAWRSVPYLFVLGFRQGHYPTRPGTWAVFGEQDVAEIRDHLALDLETAADTVARRRALLRRQLRSSRESITFLIPQRDLAGEALTPSESLTFMAQMFGAGDEPERLILDIDTETDRNAINALAIAPPAAPTARWAPETDDLTLDRDLLYLRGDNGAPLPPQSPSSLDRMLVSPLAWLLKEIAALPSDWVSETMDPLVQGSLAHAVFEILFQPDKPLPDIGDIPGLVETHLADAIRANAPLMATAQWRVEILNLQRTLTEAAKRWREVIGAMGARIVGSEIWLQGRFGRIPIHGKADCLLQLPDGTVLVVDYKKASHGTRRSCMEKGYDSQASFYRMMLQTGGAKDTADAVLAETLSNAGAIGVLYFMLNDQVALADTAVPAPSHPPGLLVLDSDVSVNALNGIRDRLRDVRGGLVRLNADEDTNRIGKETGMGTYALHDSPLVMLFARPGGDGDDEGGNAA
jgi:ATP-dependent helicase/nuclease subunit B